MCLIALEIDHYPISGYYLTAGSSADDVRGLWRTPHESQPTLTLYGEPMRKSFIIHIDSLDVLPDLTDEQAGQLFKAVHMYQKTGEHGLTGIMAAIFVSFKNQFDRDIEKYQKICERNKNNGLGGGRPKNEKTQSVILGYSGLQKKPKETQDNPKKPDSKNKNDSKSESDIKEYMHFDDFWKIYPRQRRGNKEKAERAYARAVKRDSEGAIIAGVQDYCQSDEVSKGYAKGAEAWLNDDRWKYNYTKKTNKTLTQAKELIENGW